MKFAQFIRNDVILESDQSVANAEKFIRYSNNKQLDGVYFDIRHNGIIVYQHNKDVKEPEQYNIAKNDLPLDLWKKILTVAKHGKQWE